MKRYAQIIDGSGRVVAVLDTPKTVSAPHMIEVEAGQDVIGKAWDGSAWMDVVKTEAEIAAEKLAEIDRQSGMPRLMRETLLAIAGDKAPAKLLEHETNAATWRAKLK